MTQAARTVQVVLEKLRCRSCGACVGEVDDGMLIIPHEHHGTVRVAFTRYSGTCRRKGCDKPFLFLQSPAW